MSWISNFYEDEQYYAPATNYFQSIGSTKEKKMVTHVPNVLLSIMICI